MRQYITRIPGLIVASILAFGTGARAQAIEPAGKDVTVFGFKLHYLEAGRGERDPPCLGCREGFHRR